MSRNVSFWKSLDWFSIGIYIALLVMGWLSVFGASYDFDHPEIFDFSQRAGRQMLWIFLAVLIAGAILLIDVRVYDVFAFFIYGFTILLLIATIFLAPDIKGSRSWLVFGPVSIQPAELAKFATGLALARYMSQYSFRLKGLKGYAPVVGLILLPMGLIICQHETGSALVFAAFFIMLYREGMPGVLLYLAFCCVVLFILICSFGGVLLQPEGVGSLGMLLSQAFIFITTCGFLYVYEKDKSAIWYLIKVLLPMAVIAFLVNLLINVDYNYFGFAFLLFAIGYILWKAIIHKSTHYFLMAVFVVCSIGFCYSTDYIFDDVLEVHQQTRIKVFLGMEDDPTGAGYNVNQSKIAIGSGQFFGKGFLNGTQTKLKYVPEQDTDFIFCTVGEEHGFLGSIFVIGAYLALILRLIALAERQRNSFGRIYGYSVASIFFFHFTINIGMVLGLAPVIGIPLPFFSYGGSSLWSFTILLFIFLRLDAARQAE